MGTNSRSVLLPLVVAFVIYWLGSIDLAKSAGRFQPVQPVSKKA